MLRLVTIFLGRPHRLYD